MPTDDDDRPRRRRRDDEYDDDRPRRRRDDEYDDRPGGDGAGVAAAGVSVGVVVAIIAGLLLAGLVVIGLLIALLLPAVQKVREAAARTSDMNSLKQISVATHNYHDVNRRFPPAEGNVSWRVHLLPYLEQSQIYRGFDLLQPWDSPANKRFANEMIPPYNSKRDPESAPNTHYRVFVGPHTLYEPGEKPPTIADIRDGTSNTIFAVEATETVPWPAPKELQYDRSGPLPRLGLDGRKGFNLLLLDGSVRFIPDTAQTEALRAGIDPKDGKVFVLD